MGEQLPALEKWLAQCRRVAYENHLTIDTAYINQTRLVQIRLEGECRYWPAEDPLPEGATVLVPARPGFVAVLVAVD
jgi:hypothetical protein